MRLNNKHSFNKKAFALFLAAAMAFEGNYAFPAYAQEAGKGMEESISSEAQAKEAWPVTQDAAGWEDIASGEKQPEDTEIAEKLTDGAEEKPEEEPIKKGTEAQGEEKKEEIDGSGEESEKEKTTEPEEEPIEEEARIQGREPEKEETAGSKKGGETADVEKEGKENEDGMEQEDSQEEGIGEDKEDIFNGIETLDEASVLKAANASSGKCGKNLTWTLDGKGVLTISGQGTMYGYYYSEYNPDGKKVPWKKNAVKKVIIKKGVTTIGEQAFEECVNLSEVEIAEGVTAIYYGAFRGCSNLESITIPSSVRNINGSVFEGCTNLSEVKMSTGLKEIGNNAFQGCNSLRRITIPNSVVDIGEGAFAGCSALETVGISNKITKLAYGIFSRCSSLKSIVIPDGVTYIGNFAFSNCDGLGSITIPNNVKNIDNCAFMECNGLESIRIESKAVSIEKGVFQSCKNLKSVETAEAGGVTIIKDWAFHYCENLESVKISKALTYIGDGAFGGCTSLAEVRLPNSVTNIGLEAFHYCTSLSVITLPNKLANIGIRAFEGCSSLKKIAIPESVEYIGERAFHKCSSLRDISVSEKNNIVTLGDSAFRETAWIQNQKEDFVMLRNILVKYNGNAAAVAIPENVTVIGSYALGEWDRSFIEEITFAGKNNITNVGEGAFFGTAWLKNQKGDFVMLENILVAYQGGDSTVKIPEQATVIADACFRGKKNVKGVVMHNKVITLGASSFSSSGITKVTLPGSVSSVTYCAFAGCAALENVVLEEGVKGIGLSAFVNSGNVKKITVPKSVDKIEAYSIGYAYRPRNGYSALYNIENDARNKLPTLLCFENSVAHRYAVTHEKLYQFLDKTVKAISKCKISIPASSFPYTGDPITPAVSIKDGAKKLKEGTDYLIRYEDNEGVGTATIKITGIGYYNGTVTKKFTIKSPAPKFTYKKSYSKTYGDKAFSLNIKQTGGSEKLSYSSSNKKVAAVNSSGKVTMKGTGLAIITVKSAVSKTVLKITVKVSPVRQKISSVKAVKGKKLTVAWKKDTTASGYRIQYSTDKKFKKGFKDVWVRKNKTKNTTVSKLKAGKKYYIRICSYKNIKENGKSKKLYGKWSNVVLSQKIKK